MPWLQVDFPAGQLLWISQPPVKKQKSCTEQLLSATEVSAGPASTSSHQCRSHTTANCSQRKCTCKQGLPGAIPSWHSSVACPLSPPVTSQKVLVYKTYDRFFKSLFLWSKENKPNQVTLCGRRIVLFYPFHVLTLHPTHHVKLSCWGELCQARVACVENQTLM